MGRKKKPSNAPDGFSAKKWDLLSVEWRDAAATKQTDELKEDIVKSAKEIATQRKDMKNDPVLKASMDEVKDLRGGYTDVIAAEQAKIDYALYLMTTRGAA
jgi:hypothetical protein